MEQLEENLKAVEIACKWNQELEDKINAVLDNQPATDTNYVFFQPFESRRKLSLKLDMKAGTIEYRNAI